MRSGGLFAQLFVALLFPVLALPQQAPPPPPPTPGQLVDPNAPDKRVLGVLPNYRTAEFSTTYTPITARKKINIALKDSFDYPLMGVASFYAAIYHLENTHPQFGQGTEGYFKRLGTSYTDQVVGNMMSEGILPALFHQDPRYFRLGSSNGTTRHRLGYALTRVLVTRNDSGARAFNFSEVIGNGIAACVSMSYYTDSRDPGSYFQMMGTSIGTDAISQVLREFWPDVKKRLNRHKSAN